MCLSRLILYNDSAAVSRAAQSKSLVYDVSLQAELRKTFRTSSMAAHLGNLEKLLIANEGGDGYFVGEKVKRFKKRALPISRGAVKR